MGEQYHLLGVPICKTAFITLTMVCSSKIHRCNDSLGKGHAQPPRVVCHSSSPKIDDTALHKCDVYFQHLWGLAEDFADTGMMQSGDIVTIDLGNVALMAPRTVDGCSEWIMAPGSTSDACEATRGCM